MIELQNDQLHVKIAEHGANYKVFLMVNVNIFGRLILLVGTAKLQFSFPLLAD